MRTPYLATPKPDAIRLVGAVCEPGTFLVPSASTPGRPPWAVEWQNVMVRHCFCPRFASKQSCRHTEAVAALWREEHEAALAAHRADPVRMAEAETKLKEIAEVFDR